jgi:hypothetical protein
MIRQQMIRARVMFCAAAVILGAQPAQADLYVIANPTLAVTAGDISAIYTGDKQMLGGVKLKPLDNHAGQAEFLGKVLQLNAGRYDSLWTMKSFRDGLTPPAVKATDADVLAYVQSTPGAIGYVTTAPPAGVTVLKKY